MATKIKIACHFLEKSPQATSKKISVKEHDKVADNKWLSFHGRLGQEADIIKKWIFLKELEINLKEKNILHRNLRKYVPKLNENPKLKNASGAFK